MVLRASRSLDHFDAAFTENDTRCARELRKIWNRRLSIEVTRSECGSNSHKLNGDRSKRKPLSEHLFMERVIFMRGCLRGDNGGSHEAHYSCNSDHGVDCCARFCARHKLYGLDLEAGREF